MSKLSNRFKVGFRKLNWRIRAAAGLPGRSNEEILYQIKRLPDDTGTRLFKFPWGNFEYVSRSTLAVQFHEIFISRNYAFTPNSSSPVIIDCGGNIGISAVWFKKTYPGAYLTVYEADPDLSSLLSRNLIAAGLDDVRVVNAAVWINDGQVSFDRRGNDKGSVSAGGDFTVRSLDLSSALPAVVDFLKLDVEGAEFEIMEKLCETGGLKQIKNIAAEYHITRERMDAFGSIIQRLRKAGLQVAMTAVLGPWIGLANETAPFDVVGKNQVLMQVYAWH